MKRITNLLSLLTLTAIISCGGNAGQENTGKENSSQKCDTTEWKDLLANGLEDFDIHGGQAMYDYDHGSGILTGTSGDEQRNTFLCTKEEYADFILEYEVKVDTSLNSGVQIRSHLKEEGGIPDRVYGYQVEIDPSSRSYSGGLYDEARDRDWIQSLSENPEAREAFDQEGWNHFRVVAVGDHLQTWVNGVKAADVTDERDASGIIGFQVHAIKSEEPLKVQWRKLRIKTISCE